MELRGAVAVVTGASSGIGKSTAEAFAAEGAAVILAARREDRLQSIAVDIEAQGGRATPMACDVSEWSHVQRLAKHVRSEFGRCDVLINNAGIPGGGHFADLSIEDVERVVRVNYLGVLYGTKAFLPMMLEAGRGHIVNVSSLAGRFAVPGAAVYTSTKHAVVAFSEALHFELSPLGILVTAVNPGTVATEGFPHRDMAKKGSRFLMQPDRVADVIVKVVRSGKAPEVSVPRMVAALQVFRLLAPPFYRFALQRAVKRGMRATNVREN
ncbi:MAG: SDR family NAD(P)-dependent oxidoreductase [Actinomycetota bacterium]